MLIFFSFLSTGICKYTLKDYSYFATGAFLCVPLYRFNVLFCKFTTANWACRGNISHFHTRVTHASILTGVLNSQCLLLCIEMYKGS